MKALSIHNAWAWAISAGLKRFENREWQTLHRGELAIHASANRASLDESLAFCRSIGVEPPAIEQLTFGAVVCVVDVVAMHSYRTGGLFATPCDRDPWASGPWCWELANVRQLREPLAIRGMPGLFNVDVPADLIV